jgi:hypothetical protein
MDRTTFRLLEVVKRFIVDPVDLIDSNIWL